MTMLGKENEFVATKEVESRQSVKWIIPEEMEEKSPVLLSIS